MSQLLETLKCKDGILYNLDWHNSRFNKARKEYFGLSTKMNLVNFIKIPHSFKNGLFRCRISYSTSIENIEFIPHEYRKIESIKLVVDNAIDYHLKFADRQKLQNLFEQREDCDDIIILKNGRITDSFNANLVFFDGQKWWTSDTPLLPGTQRARLIDEGKIEVCVITPISLSRYKKIGFINALQDLEEMPIIDIKNIHC